MLLRGCGPGNPLERAGHFTAPARPNRTLAGRTRRCEPVLLVRSFVTAPGRRDRIGDVPRAAPRAARAPAARGAPTGVPRFLSTGARAERARPPSTDGEPLAAGVRAHFEARLGRDLGDVRVRTDPEAARAERAAAFTVGSDIVFGAGRYAPETSAGRRLLAHELVHVVQQDAGAPVGAVPRDEAHGPAEDEARHLSAAADSSSPLQVSSRAGGARLQRDPDGNEEAGEESSPDYMSRSVIWFRLDSDQPREDAEVSSTTHLAVTLRRITEHAAVAGGAQRITLHGYASREGAEAHNMTLSTSRAERVRQLLITAGIAEDRITVAGHGPDATFPGLEWNRRVEVELTPAVTQLDFSQGLEITGTVPRTGPMPVESTRGVLTARHWALRDRPRIPAGSISEWGELDAATMWWERLWNGRSRTLASYKDDWVRVHSEIIQAAAEEYDLPAWFLAGVAWAEVGGDPTSIDYLA